MDTYSIYVLKPGTNKWVCTITDFNGLMIDRDKAVSALEQHGDRLRETGVFTGEASLVLADGGDNIIATAPLA